MTTKRNRRTNKEMELQRKQSRITQELIATRGAPIEFLCDIVQGRIIRDDAKNQMVATLQQRIDVAIKLMHKLVPDVKAVEVDDGPGDTTPAERQADAVEFLLSKLAGTAPSRGTPTHH